MQADLLLVRGMGIFKEKEREEYRDMCTLDIREEE